MMGYDYGSDPRYRTLQTNEGSADIVERLRKWEDYFGSSHTGLDDDLLEAADAIEARDDEITRLRAERDGLKDETRCSICGGQAFSPGGFCSVQCFMTARAALRPGDDRSNPTPTSPTA